MAALTVTKIHIASRNASGNKAPSSGDAWFSDGKSFGWARNPANNNTIRFYSHRRRAHGGHEFFGFESPKRAAAVEAYLNAM